MLPLLPLLEVAVAIFLLGVGSFVALMAIGGIVVIALLGLPSALVYLPVVFVGNAVAHRLRKDEKLGKHETTFQERVATLSCSAYRASLLSHALASVRGNQTYQYLLIKENVDLLAN